MATINYYLNNKVNKEGKAQILLYFCYPGKRIPVATDEFIKPEHWNANKKQVKASVTGARDINEKLQRWETLVMEAYRKFQLAGKLADVPEIKLFIKEILNPSLKAQEPKRFDLAAFGEYLAEQSTGIKSGTAVNYIKTVRRLREFELAKRKGKPVQFSDVDRDFYNDFVKWLYTDRMNAKNTVGNHIKFIKKFMNEAVNQELTDNMKFKRFETLSEEVENIYLNRAELKHLFELDLSDYKRLDEVRDRFLIGCYTGLRYSDVQRLNRDNISGEFIRIRTIKTDDQVIIPLHPILKKIIEKYDSNFPAAISNQKMNDYLKLLGKAAGFNEEFTTSKTMAANKRVFKSNPKHSLITTHTARRSFATNAFLDGIPSLIIMAITGHKTEKSFLKYIKVTKDEHAAKLAQLWQNIERSQMTSV